ncbi:MAG: methionyl-tRNA formyltransferase [Prevotellaceae bacterium]|jgi:methionyl-tRNA formyltransferase|nr:methionyl-tRNA formyltransferase [Prevotellaceae bacterium]
MKSTLKIVYMGTPEFAVEPLRVLLENGYNIVAVVAAPDKPAGRGRELKQPEVKQFALAHHLPVLQPEKLRDENFIATLKSLNADLFLVVAFRMLPEIVWSMPPKGTVNLHASLLPDYRGAAPINHAIINGETTTGVTTFVITHEIDTGEIFLQKKVEIGIDETAGELHDKLMIAGASLLLETVEKIESGEIKPFSQPETADIHPAPKLFRENCEIDWNLPAERVRNLIRGLSPSPGAWCELKNDTKSLQIKILKASVDSEKTNGELSGTICSNGKNFLKIACADRFLNVEELQPQGKKIMPVKAFLAGFRDITSYRSGK